MSVTDPPPAPPIVFGTDGWRARIGEEYTYENVRRCAQGVAEWVLAAGHAAKGVVVGYDRRFASEHFAAAAAEVLLAYDIPVPLRGDGHPDADDLVRGRRARRSPCARDDHGLHNPWTDNGFKIKSPTGAAADPTILTVVEAVIRANAGETPPRRPIADGEAAGSGRALRPVPGLRGLPRAASLDLERLKAADVRVLVDPLCGSGAGWIPRLLAGGRIVVDEIHAERNPWFGGVNPEPIRAQRRRGAGASVQGGGYDLGLLLDGDADRAGAADERGDVHPPARRSWACSCTTCWSTAALRQPVVSTINETSMVGPPGRAYGVAVHETPVGFKYVGPKMIETGAMMGGEESGGYGFGMHLPERDGIYADLLLLDLFIREREAGRWPVSSAVQHLHDIAGPSFYLRNDVHADRATYPALKARLLVELREQAPASLAGQAVVRTDALDTNDGFKFWVTDGSWLLVRFSGTEPLVRVYAEATSARPARRAAGRGRAVRDRPGERRRPTRPAASSTTRVRCVARTPGGMLDAIGGIAGPGARCLDPFALADAADGHRAARSVAVLGMGGSAIGGDLVRGIWSDRLRVPVEVVRGYDLPAWVGRETLVVASSNSGAHGGDHQRLRPGRRATCPVAIITTGGPLLDVARRADLPHLTFPGGGQPRAAVGYSITLLAGLLERAGMLAIDDAEVGAAVAAADAAVGAAAPGVATAANLAKQLAWSLVDRIPVIEAGGFLAPVARRWKTQLNENGKSGRGVEELPEATHNTVVGLSPTGWHPGPPDRGLPGERRRPPSQRAACQAVTGAAERRRHRPPGGDQRWDRAASHARWMRSSWVTSRASTLPRCMASTRPRWWPSAS